jgi:DNA-binding PadR family transcriptional regulator
MQWTMLAILAEGPRFGLEIKEVFDRRTGDLWPLNPGQVYSTLSRLESRGFVALVDAEGPDGHKTYAITKAGRERLERWYSEPAIRRAPMRDETVLKILMANAEPGRDVTAVFTVERMAVLKRLQDLTRLKQQDPSSADLGWQCLLESLIYQAEARIRWLDACESRLAHARSRSAPPKQPPTSNAATTDQTAVSAATTQQGHAKP